MSTTIYFTNGETAEASLSYLKLMELSARDKKTYDEYQRLFMNGIKSDLDMVHQIYTAYCCENTDAMTKKEFLSVFPEDRNILMDLFSEVTGGGKKS